jgi:hypothetical protein
LTESGHPRPEMALVSRRGPYRPAVSRPGRKDGTAIAVTPSRPQVAINPSLQPLRPALRALCFNAVVEAPPASADRRPIGSADLCGGTAFYRSGLGSLERRRSFGGRAALHLKDGLQVLPGRIYNTERAEAAEEGPGRPAVAVKQRWLPASRAARPVVCSRPRTERQPLPVGLEAGPPNRPHLIPTSSMTSGLKTMKTYATK